MLNYDGLVLEQARPNCSAWQPQAYNQSRSLDLPRPCGVSPELRSSQSTPSSRTASTSGPVQEFRLPTTYSLPSLPLQDNRSCNHIRLDTSICSLDKYALDTQKRISDSTFNSSQRPDTTYVAQSFRDIQDLDLEKGPTTSEISSVSHHSSAIWESAHQTVMPKKLGSRGYRLLRWKFFSTYQRLFTLIVLVNLGVFLTMCVSKSPSFSLSYNDTLSAASINLTIAMLVRHEHVINAMFLATTSLPITAPLALRRLTAKVYGYGGLHSSCSIAAVVWYLAFAVLVTEHLVIEPRISITVAILTYVIIMALIAIVILALPAIRARFHNSFEATHRFAGWTVVGLFWAQTLLMANSNRNDATLGGALIKLPAFWCLIVITLCVIYPWLLLRKHDVHVERCSKHAVRVHFSHGNVDYGAAVRLSKNPLRENHAFAVIPRQNGEKGFSVIVSNAGDWTKSIINDPPSSLWVKGSPTLGVIRVAVMFKPALVVATGSGIGPCLSIFHGRPDHPFRLLWSTKDPLETYGPDVIDSVRKADPQALVINTRKSGRPDLVAMAYRIYKQGGCEAVVVISNARVTGKIVYGLESRGVPAYGPIFDS